MGDRDKGEPTIELIDVESLFQSTLMDPKFVRKSISAQILPRAIRTSPGSHPGGGCRVAIMSKSNRSIPPACTYAEAASAEPQLQCSCAAQERTRKKLSRLPVGESVRIIERSSWQPCTTSLALKSGSLGVKTQRVPTILRSVRFQHAQFTLRQWQCCLVLLPFVPFTCHGSKQQTLILWRL